ncbi:THUMP domain-containing class I SAM-dependent RNA methyltransferase [Taibaiella koreensis]|uniref:THUMP domain-containing class I SAM-dependent RNA methyltransferase n=1 Tax=Taibaiella koreensis TaxID=1268548 RepID=UPI000E59ECE5|nr:class I SAM-dependent RNA methyltransferase [Taibaiella koreensis]
MSLFNITAPVTVTCHKRLAVYLEQEITALGFSIEERFVTGVRLQGTLNDCIRLNLNLRCASQVLFRLDQFEARHPDDIYENVLEIGWEDLLPDGGYFSVTSNVLHDTINNNLYANLRVKDAIVDRLRSIRGVRPETGAELRGAVIHLFWKEDEAEVFLDTSGDSLGRHGYRKIPGRAPMLEALAAATVMATAWDGVGPFVNPMCGSGTLAIEAALIATDARPGLFRQNYAFMHLSGYDENRYLDERGTLEKQIKEVPGLRIVATDYSEAAIGNARKNARAAGVEDLITFAICDFADTEIPEGRGAMMMNPEYGERLGTQQELEMTYARIGDFMKQRCKGYHGYVFTGNMELAKKIGLKAKRRIEFYNATIDCRLLEYELYAGSRD